MGHNPTVCCTSDCKSKDLAVAVVILDVEESLQVFPLKTYGAARGEIGADVDGLALLMY